MLFRSSTNRKLELLNKSKGLPRDKFEQIWRDKQEITLQLFGEVSEDKELVKFISFLAGHGIHLAVASNSIRNTVDTVLDRLGISNFFNLTLSNEDVSHHKPHPEIYWRCMMHFGALPSSTVIFEDSHIGKQAAISSGAHLIPVDRREDLTWNKIESAIAKAREVEDLSQPWKSDKLNVLIPMAGAGSRFEAAGYTFPKPLIDINGKPMVQVVVNSLNIDAKFIYVVRKEHRDKYNLDSLLNLITPNCTIIEVSDLTEGAACTTLLAKQFINNKHALLLVNSDQYIEWNSNEFMYKMMEQDLDGGIVTFKSTHPKWSFVKINEQGYVTDVAEKNPISDIATVGIYYWKHGSDYVKYAEQMIQKNIRVNNEFYVCPVFNQAILDNKKIKTFDISKMWGLGTPEDLQLFLKQNK